MAAEATGAGWRSSAWLVRLCVLVSVMAALYAAYRGYYALGGTAGMFGEFASRSQWLLVNAVGAVAIALGALVPLVALPLSRWRPARAVLLALFSLAAVGLVMHAVVDEAQRALSLSGLAARWGIELTAASTQGWIWKDQRASDLQDMLVNEPWFLLEGLLCGAVVWTALGPGRVRRRWLVGVVAATLALSVYGFLSAVGVGPRTVVF